MGMKVEVEVVVWPLSGGLRAGEMGRLSGRTDLVLEEREKCVVSETGGGDEVSDKSVKGCVVLCDGDDVKRR